MSISIRYNSKVLPRFYYLIQSACKRKTKKLRWFFLFHVWRHSIKYSMYVNSILKKITKISSGSITLITLYFRGTRSFRFFLQQDFRQHFKKSCMTVYTYFLDRHHAWRSLDPTPDIWSNFVKKKKKKRKHFTSSFAILFLSPPLLH